jgi:hypothetical protein
MMVLLGFKQELEEEYLDIQDLLEPQATVVQDRQVIVVELVGCHVIQNPLLFLLPG